MRRIVISFVVIMAACATGTPATTAPGDLPRQALSAPETTLPSDESTATTTADEPKTNEPRMLDAVAVLLTELDFGEPWSESFRTDLSPGWDPGPGQTDCPAYDAFEAQQAVPSARAGWWRDGYNFNHESLAYPNTREAQDTITAMRALPEQCENVNWLEGGTFQVAPLDVGPDAVGVEFVEDAGQIQWFAFLQRDNIVSRLNAVSFGATPLSYATHLADFNAVVADAHALLFAAPEAGIVESPPPTTTSTVVAPAQTGEAFEFVYAPLLLDAADFIGDVEVETGRKYSGESGTEDCPPSESYALVAGWMLIHMEATGADMLALHEVGFPEDRTDPVPAVRDIARLGDCDWGEEAIGVESGPLEGLPEPIVAAAYMTITDGRANAAIAVVALEDGVVSRFMMSAADVPRIADLTPLITAFLERLPAFDDHVAECTLAELRWSSGEFTEELALILDRCEGIVDYLAGVDGD